MKYGGCGVGGCWITGKVSLVFFDFQSLFTSKSNFKVCPTKQSLYRNFFETSLNYVFPLSILIPPFIVHQFLPMALNSQTLFKSTLFYFFTFIFSTSSLDDKSKLCAPTNCGHGPDIAYPFWIDGVHDSSCGLPDFEIKCNDLHYPVLEISDEDFIIKNIFPQTHSFLLVTAAAYKDSCPFPSHNISFDGKPFHYASDTEDLFFFYDCPLIDKVYIHELSCARNKTHFSFAIFHKELLEVEKIHLELCDHWNRVPIPKSSSADLGDLKNPNYVGDILNRGFVLNWTAEDCRNCKKKGRFM